MRSEKHFERGPGFADAALTHNVTVVDRVIHNEEPRRVESPADLQGALQRALQNAPAVIDVVTSQSVLSSDAQKGLGFVPDYQALTTWDEAERKRREAR